MDNLSLLTHGARVWQAKRAHVRGERGAREITFDEDARREFLTGFHKRKVERKRKAVEHAKNMERQTRNRERLEKRRAIAELAKRMEAERKGISLDEKEPSLSDDEGQVNASASDEIEDDTARVAEYTNSKLHTTVTVMDIPSSNRLACDLAAAWKHHQEKQQEEGGGGDEVDDEGKLDAASDGENQTFASADASSSSVGRKPKKSSSTFKYSSKGERKASRSKQLATHRKKQAGKGKFPSSTSGVKRKQNFKRKGKGSR